MPWEDNSMCVSETIYINVLIFKDIEYPPDVQASDIHAFCRSGRGIHRLCLGSETILIHLLPACGMYVEFCFVGQRGGSWLTSAEVLDFWFYFWRDWNHCMMSWKGNPTEGFLNICSSKTELDRRARLRREAFFFFANGKENYSGMCLLKNKHSQLPVSWSFLLFRKLWLCVWTHPKLNCSCSEMCTSSLIPAWYVPETLYCPCSCWKIQYTLYCSMSFISVLSCKVFHRLLEWIEWYLLPNFFKSTVQFC